MRIRSITANAMKISLGAAKKAMSIPSSRSYLYFFILVAVASFVIYFVSQDVIDLKAIGSAFLAMIGTFIGALFAFRLNESKDNAQLSKERRASLYRAQLVVMRQYDAVHSLAKSLSPYKTDFDRAFNCPAFQLPSYSDLTHDFDSLVFLLEAEPNLVKRMTITQYEFHQVMESLRVRNEFNLDEIQPAIASGGFNKRTFLVQDLEAALGEKLFGRALNYARNLHELVSQCEGSLLDMNNELFDTAKKLYPDSKFVKLSPET